MVSSRQHPPSGIKVIIVGAGIGGLTCAIECRNKGHDVTILEAFPKFEILGDIISFGPNAGRIVERWGNGRVLQQLMPLIIQNRALVLYRFDGTFITEMPTYGLEFGALALNGHRGEMHKIFFDFALSQGIDIRLGKEVEEYWEEEGKAGVIVDGQRMEADVVVAADGVKSKARKIVLGFDDKPRSSGYAIWRSWFTSESFHGDPLLEFFLKEDTHVGWLGPDVHFIAASLKQGRDISWVCTHRDNKDIEEDYSFPGKVEDVQKCVEGWDPVVQALVKKTPSCVDWKLVYREPMPTWISKGGRTLLLGDAAHPFLPTSIQGASQAMEDGVVLACTLYAAGRPQVPLAVRAYERIRYERCRRAQLMGETNRDKWHKADFDSVTREEEKSDTMKLPNPPWLFCHDAEAHALAVYHEVAYNIRTGAYGTEEIGYQTGILRRPSRGPPQVAQEVVP